MGKQIDVLNNVGQITGTLELPDSLFGVEVSEYALYRAVVAYEANQRQGNAAAKGRAEVNRSGKKHHRQKGTGWARRGSLRSPLVRGGGVAFGPQLRSYRSKLPKALKRLAFYSALTLKRESNQVKVIDDFIFSKPSTKDFQSILVACGLREKKVLFVAPASLPVLVKSCRNIPSVWITPVETLCTYEVIKADTLLFTRRALERLVEIHSHV